MQLTWPHLDDIHTDISLMIPNSPSDEVFGFGFPVHVDQLDISLPTDDYLLDLEEFDFEPISSEPILSGEIGEMSGPSEECEGSIHSQQLSVDGGNQWSLGQSIEPSDESMDETSIQPSLILPTEDMEIDNQLSIIHLLKAYGEAMEKEQTQLGEAIMKCISEKASPVGGTMERLLYYSLFEPLDKKDSDKNFNAAFCAFYNIFPHRRFAHFSGNTGQP